ncbi:MAG: hypothetical protein F9K46_12090 [Anaerolineae bacterium]|nr:MAG: hypothetical protein F9K46_12090 [Anaerolineae bacterium]
MALCGILVVCLVGTAVIVQDDDDNTDSLATIPEATNGAIDTAMAATLTKTAQSGRRNTLIAVTQAPEATPRPTQD